MAQGASSHGTTRTPLQLYALHTHALCAVRVVCSVASHIKRVQPNSSGSLCVFFIGSKPPRILRDEICCMMWARGGACTGSAGAREEAAHRSEARRAGYNR